MTELLLLRKTFTILENWMSRFLRSLAREDDSITFLINQFLWTAIALSGSVFFYFFTCFFSDGHISSTQLVSLFTTKGNLGNICHADFMF